MHTPHSMHIWRLRVPWQDSTGKHIYIHTCVYTCTYVAIFGSVLQCNAECCSVLQCVAVCCPERLPTQAPHSMHTWRLRVPWHDSTGIYIHIRICVCIYTYRAIFCSVTAVWCSVMQCVAVCCSVLQCVAVSDCLRTPHILCAVGVSEYSDVIQLVYLWIYIHTHIYIYVEYISAALSRVNWVASWYMYTDICLPSYECILKKKNIKSQFDSSRIL